MGERCYKLGELAVLVGGELEGDADLMIRGVAGIREAQPGDITFVANPRYEEFVPDTRASAWRFPTRRSPRWDYGRHSNRRPS